MMFSAFVQQTCKELVKAVERNNVSQNVNVLTFRIVSPYVCANESNRREISTEGFNDTITKSVKSMPIRRLIVLLRDRTTIPDNDKPMSL